MPLTALGTGGPMSRSGCQASDCKEWVLFVKRVSFSPDLPGKNTAQGTLRQILGRASRPSALGS